MRIGHGYDVHRLTENRKLILGGVEIPYEKGLLGHSDADVLLHAIADALLGAAAMGDIGKLFPDNDPAYSGADSLLLLKDVCQRVKRKGFRTGNIDATSKLVFSLNAYISTAETSVAVGPNPTSAKPSGLIVFEIKQPTVSENI